MFRVTRRLLGVLRVMRREWGGNVGCDDTEHLRSSAANATRLDAAIAELNAGRGSLTSMSKLAARLGDAVAR